MQTSHNLLGGGHSYSGRIAHLIKIYFHKSCLVILNETPMFPEVKYTNPEHIQFSINGSNAPSCWEVNISSATDIDAQMFEVLQLRRIYLILGRIFAVVISI